MLASRKAALPHAQRLVLLAAVVVVSLFTVPAAVEPYALPKAVAVAVAAVAVLGLGVVIATRRGQVILPWLPATTAVAVFVVAAILATLTSDVPAISFFGVHGRSTGLLLYGATSVTFLVAAQRFDLSGARAFCAVLLATAGVVAVWALLERLGVGGFGGSTALGEDVTLTSMGNPNFVAAYLAIATPIGLWGTMSSGWPSPWRASSGIVLALLVAALLLTRSAQGPVSAAAGAVVFVLGWLWFRRGNWRRIGVGVLLLAAALGGVLAVLGVLGQGPLAGLATVGNVRLRTFYWAAAADIVSDRPLLGVGLDRYAAFFRAYQSLEASVDQGVRTVADAPHNVVLGMFANGGVVLGLAYLAVIGVTVAAFVRGLQRADGVPPRLLLCALGGAWMAYQVQSLVSIDFPSLAFLHWLLAGIIVALGAPLPVTWPTKAGGRARGVRRRRAAWAVPLAATTVVAVGLAAMVVASRPLRADLAMARALRLGAAGDAPAALAAAERATTLAPWVVDYWLERGRLFIAANNVESARQAAEGAAAHDPRSLAAVVTAARGAAELGDADCALAWYERALQLEPNSPQLAEEFSMYRTTVDKAASPADCAGGPIS